MHHVIFSLNEYVMLCYVMRPLNIGPSYTRGRRQPLENTGEYATKTEREREERREKRGAHVSEETLLGGQVFDVGLVKT